ncbi:hypothetical protein AAC387_Pa05g3171 [Persea americana]
MNSLATATEYRILKRALFFNIRFQPLVKKYRTIGAITGVILTCCFVFILCLVRKLSSDNSIFFWKKKTRDSRNVEAFLENYGSLASKRYRYSELKTMTNSFKDNLGHGGYGSVFKGSRKDGRPVAVRVLNNAKGGNGDEFIDKVASIDFGLAKLCPQQQSTLSMLDARGTIGYTAPEVFCRSVGSVSHKSDVYSYGMMVLEMIGGRKNIDAKAEKTSEIHFPHWVYKQIELKENLGLLGFQIEAEEDIAKKMVYRYSELRKLTNSFKEDIGQGGFGSVFKGNLNDGHPVAVKVLNNSKGGVSHKSDVYSYGMKVLEMIGGRKNIDAKAEKTRENYFPRWVYEHIELKENLALLGFQSEAEDDLGEKWC